MDRIKIVLNGNKEIVREVREAVKQNDGYCPCKIDKTDDTKCMCKEFREQYLGYCHCGLYKKELVKD